MILSKLQQIVRLREMLKKWRRLAHKASRLKSVDSLLARSLLSASFHKRSAFMSGEAAPAATARVPAGHLAVYVGEERKRFVIKTSHLSHPVFKALLKQTGEEVGFHHEGALTIPYEAAFFERLLCLVDSKSQYKGALHRVCSHADDDDHHLHHQHLHELLDFYFAPDNLAMAPHGCTLQQSTSNSLYNFSRVSQALAAYR